MKPLRSSSSLWKVTSTRWDTGPCFLFSHRFPPPQDSGWRPWPSNAEGFFSCSLLRIGSLGFVLIFCCCCSDHWNRRVTSFIFQTWIRTDSGQWKWHLWCRLAVVCHLHKLLLLSVWFSCLLSFGIQGSFLPLFSWEEGLVLCASPPPPIPAFRLAGFIKTLLFWIFRSTVSRTWLPSSGRWRVQ